MIRLEQALSDFKQQVLKALQDKPPQGSGVALEAERVTLTLELEARQTPGPAGKPIISFFVCESNPPSPASHANGNVPQARSSHGRHAMTMEFKAIPAQSKQAPHPGELHFLNSESSGQSEPAPGIPDDPALLAALSAVIGAPGFDSSARAAIFRELMQNLPPDKTGDLIDSLRQPPGTPIDEDISQACHLMRGILLSGPARSVSKGAEVFEQIFARHTMQNILVCLETAWKTQDDWM